METTQKNFRFSDETMRQFEALVEYFGETESDVVRRLIAERYVALFGVPEEQTGSDNHDHPDPA